MTTESINYGELEGLKAVEAVLKLAEGLTAAEQLDIAMKLLGGLKKAVGKVKAKAPKAEGEEPKAKSEGQSKWLAGCARVREVLKEDPRYKPTHAMRVASALKEHPAWPEPEATVILEALETYLEANPDDAGSATSGGSKASKSSSKKSLKEMTEEERKAYYKARAAKAAATKAAKKVDGAAAAPAPEEAVAPAAEAEDEVEMEDEEPKLQPKSIELDFGKGKQTFGYIDHGGKRYIFKADGSLLGMLNESTGKLKKVKAEENPFA
jgi:hypothetical protein